MIELCVKLSTDIKLFNVQIFKSREEMCNWCQEAGKRIGFVVVIKKSDLDSNVRKPRIMFGCERSGTYRSRSIKEKGLKTKASGTKKYGCPFTLRERILDIANDWMLIIIYGVHNHPTVE